MSQYGYTTGIAWFGFGFSAFRVVVVVDVVYLQIRQQNRQDMKTAGPQSQVLAGVITDDSLPVRIKY